MLKLLFALSSVCWWVGCTDSSTASSEEVERSRLHTAPSNPVAIFELNLEQSNAHNVKALQQWWSTLSAEQVRQVENKKLTVFVEYRGNTSFLNSEDHQVVQEQLAYYEGVLHRMIGDINGYNEAVVAKNSVYTTALPTPVLRIALLDVPLVAK